MAQYLIYVNAEKVENLAAWLRYPMGPHSKTLRLAKIDVAFHAEARKYGFVSMMIGHEEYTRLGDFLNETAEPQKLIDREAVLVEYLKRMGVSERTRFSPTVQSAEDFITIIADIIEEKYF